MSKYSGNFEEYVRLKSEMSGMSFQDYINSKQREGLVDEILEEKFSAGEYFLIAAGISDNSNGVKLLQEQISEYSAEVAE